MDFHKPCIQQHKIQPKLFLSHIFVIFDSRFLSNILSDLLIGYMYMHFTWWTEACVGVSKCYIKQVQLYLHEYKKKKMSCVFLPMNCGVISIERESLVHDTPTK